MLHTDEWIWILIAILFLTVSLLGYQQLLRWKMQQIKQEELHQKDLVQEREHTLQRLAEELHDNLNQVLCLQHLYLKENLKTPDMIYSQQTIALNEVMQGIVKNMCNCNHPASLGTYPLTELLSDLVQSYAAYPHLNVQLNMTPTINQLLHPSAQIMLLRILQEVIHNIMKHTDATHIDLEVGNTDANIWIKLCANDKPKAPGVPGKGMGLPSIAKRVALLGATMDYNYAAHTYLNLSIPYPTITT